MDKKQGSPEYYYHRHMGSYKLYRNNPNGLAEKIDQHWDEEVIRKKTYELNGWEYTPKKMIRHES